VYAYEARSVLVLLATAPKGPNKCAFAPLASASSRARKFANMIDCTGFKVRYKDIERRDRGDGRKDIVTGVTVERRTYSGRK